MNTHLSAEWLDDQDFQALFDVVEANGANLRIVGGAVRDGLLGLPVDDIDLAIDKDPQWVMDLLEKNKFRVIPTGIDHGTVTVVIHKRPYQITTLRVDVQTFGRKAHVAFTEDWVQDAKRRDFTVNALYADRTGKIYDPVGGLEDLRQHRVRFIGDAELRIKEDYLRILRFFRFSARFGHEPYDQEGLDACRLYASHLPHLAKERVTEEFLKILDLSSLVYTLESLQDTGVLLYILHPGTWSVLKALVSLENERKIQAPAMVRLAALQPSVSEIKAHLRLSRAQESTLNFLTQEHETVTLDSFKSQAFRWGKQSVFDLALLQVAMQISEKKISQSEGNEFLRNIHANFEKWVVPTFPLSGKDVLAQGIKKGEEVGDLLRAVEKWWLSMDLEPNHNKCLAYLKILLDKTSE